MIYLLEFHTNLEWGTFSPQLAVVAPDDEPVPFGADSDDEAKDWV